MGLLTRRGHSAPRAVASTGELRLDNDADVSLINRIAYGGGLSKSGISVSAESAMRVSAFFACNRILSEDVAKLPCILYKRRPDGGKERGVDHPLYDVVHARPNSWQTPFEFREQMQGSLAPRGNAYAIINRLPNGEVHDLLPLPPHKVTVRQDSAWNVTYRIEGESKDRPASDILHLRAFSTDGITGLSLVALARESIGLSLATESHGAKLFGNMARPSGILKTPNKLSKEAAEQMRDQWEQALGGENLHRVVVLQNGTEWTQTGMTSKDAEFLLTRQFQLSDIARWFRMPPHKLGILTDATYSNIEMQSIEYVVDTLMPWLVRWEQRLSASLLTRRERKEFFFEFLVDGLLRGEIKARMEAYGHAIDKGILNPNEVRARENLNPRPGGDEYLRPLNMATSGAGTPQEAQAKAISIAAYMAERERGLDVEDAGRACVAAYRAALAA